MDTLLTLSSKVAAEAAIIHTKTINAYMQLLYDKENAFLCQATTLGGAPGITHFLTSAVREIPVASCQTSA